MVASWLGGSSTHDATWLFHRASRTVTPLDDTAADLLSDRPIRPVVAPEPPRPTLVGAPPLMPGVVAFPPMPDAHTGPLPVVEEVFDQEAPPEGPRHLPPAVAAPVPPPTPRAPEGRQMAGTVTRCSLVRYSSVHRTCYSPARCTHCTGFPEHCPVHCTHSRVPR